MHMTCKCKYEFCWCCLGKYRSKDCIQRLCPFRQTATIMSLVLVILLTVLKFMLAMEIFHYVLDKCLWILSILWFLIKFVLYYGSVFFLA
mmetsp:Transcript_30268/g.29588  ORF Transcript_30268/g.29588 Transcript_30268/m.29588 type:complete len:90 (-) Transcript_30268:120-389(-)